MGKRALVFGASGVTGWSFVNEFLNDYPKKGIWDGVVAMTNRPLKQEDSLWPADARLQIVSGVNLLGTQDEIEKSLKEKVKDVDKITHVYYLAYKASTDMQQELEDAVNMFKRSTIAMDHLSPALEFVVLQTGAKMYGCHLLENHPTDYIHVPLSEDQPRLKQPYHDMLFYHPQIDWITGYAKEKKWSWCETRPDIIIGFVPNQNFYSLATVLGIYLSLYATVEGRGVECPFPGTEKSWVAKSNDSSSDMIARQTIHLSLNLPKDMEGEGFNVADARQPETWKTKWPKLCDYFGLKGTGPKDGLEVRKYINDHIDTWKKLEKENGLKQGVADSDLTFKGFEVRHPKQHNYAETNIILVLPHDPIRLRQTVRHDQDLLYPQTSTVHGRAQHRAGMGRCFRQNA
jgi:nucleoside-diphosphate-sugar epimerase